MQNVGFKDLSTLSITVLLIIYTVFQWFYCQGKIKLQKDNLTVETLKYGLSNHLVSSSIWPVFWPVGQHFHIQYRISGGYFPPRRQVAIFAKNRAAGALKK